MSWGTFFTLVAVYSGCIFGGWILVGGCMAIMRCIIRKPRKCLSKRIISILLKMSIKPIDLFVGGTERTVATALTVLVPNLLPSFIGAWMAFKIAAHWQREAGPYKSKKHRRRVTTGHQLALVGSAISFAIAIEAGLMMNGHALVVWNPPIENPSAHCAEKK